MAYLTSGAPDGIEVLSPTGDLGDDDVERLTARIPVEFPGGCILDLREVTFLSVSGWRVVVRAAYRAREVGANWVLVPGPAVRPYLQAEGTEPLRVADTVEAAVALLAAGHGPAVTGFVGPGRTQC